MKTTKKVLSVFLAVLMIMSSMSVCFGSISFAAPASKSTYDADPIVYLAEHLNSDTIQWVAEKYSLGNGSISGTQSVSNSGALTYTTDVELPTYEQYVEVRDILIYLDLAIKGTTEFGKAKAGNTDYETRACTCSGFIETELLNAIGSSLSDAGKEFIEYLLYDNYARQHADAYGVESYTHSSHTTTLNVYTTDIIGYLKEVGEYTNVESSVELGYTHSIYLTRGYYESGSLIKFKYYHNYLKYSENTAAPSEMTKKANTEIQTTVTDYVSTVNNTIATYTFDKLASMTIDEIEEVVANLNQARTDIKASVNSDSTDNYKTLFPGVDDKISAFEETANKAKEIAVYSTTVAEIAAYKTSNPNYGIFNWGGFNEATIKAAYADFMGKYGVIINDATLYDYFTANGSIDDTYVKNFRDNTIAYDLEDLKEEKIMPLYNKYALSFPMEGGEEVSLAEKQAAYSELSGYINNIKSYSAQVQNAIFSETLNKQLLDLQEKLECQVADCVLYFAENVLKDYSDVATDAVIAEIGTAKSNLAALNALLNSIDYADNKKLLDTSFTNADTFIAYLYSLLAERYTAQIEIVDKTYTAIERPTSNLTLSQYSHLNAYVNGIETEIVDFLDSEGKGNLVSSQTRGKYAAIDTELMPAFRAFEIDRGFNNYSPEDILIRREDSTDEIFRVNENLDDDMLGEYEVTDKNVNAIIDLLEAALKDPTVASLLGSLINKDEDGNPTGEAFSISGLVTNLLNESVFTDELLNTIIQFVYPLVLKEFAKVWAGLPPTITITVENVVGSLGADVACGLALDDVETAIASVGLYIGPKALASNLSKNFSEYTQVINKLNEVTIKASYNKDRDTFRNPWEDTVLFKTVTNEDGSTKEVYDLDWGINTAENKREAFVDAAVAALSGLEPLLLALLTNKDFVNDDVTDGDPRGVKIGTGSGSATVSIITLNLTIDPITLVLTFEKNDGWDNALAPIFEALGLENIPHSEDLQSTRKLLENGLLAMIDQLIAKLDANPIEFILDALPNLCYAIEAGLIEPLLYQIKTVINYYADAYYSAAGIVTDTLLGAMKSDEPININIGDMINLKDMGLDISNFQAIWNMLSGVELLSGVEAPDAAYIASLGKLVEKDTNRSVKTYTAGTTGQAYHIQANRADVLQYLVKWVLESGLLNGLVEEPSELIAGIFANLENNSGDAIAAIVELLNQQLYPSKNYNWFNGYIDGESVVGNSANEIYLNPNNDWTEDKAQYIYDNLEAIVAAVLTMAKVDLDKETEEIETLEEFVDGMLDGLLSDKTLTSLAALLAKLDLNALLAGEDGEEAAIDANALVNDLLGIDLASVASKYADIAAAKEADENYVYDFGVDAGTTTFSAALTEMLAPLDSVLGFILTGDNIEITFAKDTEGAKSATLIGYDGYNNAIIPLLEALGCTVAAQDEMTGTQALEATLDALLAKIDALTTNTDEEGVKDGLIYGVIDMLPGILYFLSSNGVSTTVLNLLQPVFVILDTIKPVYDLDINELINGLLEEKGIKIDIERLNTNAVINIVSGLIGLDLTKLNSVIYDACQALGVDYSETAKSTLQTTWKKGAYSDNFTQADMLTVVLSFLLEWVTVEENAEALDNMLGTDGIVAALSTVFADVSDEIVYSTPNWMYWFETQEEFEDYIATGEGLPNTLLALEYPNDWDEYTAAYIANNLPAIVDEVVALIEINGVKHDSVSALLNSLISDYISADTINDILDMLKDVLANIDDALLDCGYLLDVDLVGLKNYTCTKEITTISDFAAELAYILDTYAPTIVNLLFFGDDIRLAKKSDRTDTIVINGGLGYEKGLALILEVLGCDVPVEDEATDEKEVTTATVLGALAKRIEYILAEGNTVNAVIDLLPNLIYFLNANGLSVAVNNLLQPVYAIVDKVNALGVLEEPINIADLIKFKTTDEDGNEKEVKLNLDTLTLDYIVDLVETLTGLDLTVVDEMLVDFCLGKIEKGAYTYKMTAAREDVITLVLTVALLVVETEGNAEVIDELIGKDIIAGIKEIISGANIEYTAPEWNYALAADNALIDYAITYPNNWTDVTATYVAENLDEIVDAVISLIEINGVKHESVSALIDSMVNIYTKENLEAIQKLLADLIGGLDEDLKDLVNIALGAADALLGADVNGLINYDVTNVNDKESFIDALTGMLMEVEGLVNWLLLGEDYEFFVDDDDDMVYEDGEAIITITGANGYAEGLALLLEALGCENLPTVYDQEPIDTEATVKAVLTSLANRIDEVLANPVEEVVELLPNIFYFLNTNGVAAVIDNTIAAVMALVEKLDVFGVELDINELVNLKKILKIEDTDAKISLDNLAMSDILEAVSLMTGLDITMIEDVLVGFALGQIAEYDSVSAQVGTAKKMSYKDDFDKADLLTVVATLALLTLTDDENAEVVTNLLGEGVYNTIINVINMEQFVPEMKTMNWILTEYADTNTAVSGIATSELYKDWGYGTLYTEEMAQYIADNFGKFVDNILFLLGIEINGVSVESLKEIFDELLGGTLYTTDTLNTVLNLLRKIPSFITDFAGADLTKHVNEILKTSIGVDLTYWDAYEVAEVTDREGFVAELCRMLEPFYPVLKWLLADEDFAFFVDGANEGDDMIVLYGAEGYAYGIAPILEALQCEGVLSGEDYLAAVEADDGAILSSILTPLLDKVDTILYAEENGSTIADEILALLPSVIYFINSNGLDTSVKNLLNAVYTVLNAIEPITGEINLYDLIGLDLENLTFEEIFDLLLEMIGGAAGYDLSSFSADYVAELTTGYVVSYTSANGETAYTMVYAEGESGTASDMVTIIIRLALTFLALEENQAKVLAILAEQFNMDADAQKYLAGVFEAIAECEIGTQIGMDKACAVVYYLFYGADIGVDFAATGIKDLNAEWQKVLEELGKTPLGTEPTFGNLISRFLDVTMKDILDDVLNSDGVAPNGFIKFFQKIIDWFKSLMAWFQSIFS